MGLVLPPNTNSGLPMAVLAPPPTGVSDKFVVALCPAATVAAGELATTCTSGAITVSVTGAEVLAKKSWLPAYTAVSE